jgi:hypothetical protein
MRADRSETPKALRILRENIGNDRVVGSQYADLDPGSVHHPDEVGDRHAGLFLRLRLLPVAPFPRRVKMRA